MATATVIPINNKRFAAVVKTCNVYESEVISPNQCAPLVIYDIPFKIRVQNITVPGYSPFDVPPIGIAIIGVNNYIL